MTYPPANLPTNRTNDTLTRDTHPGDHNAAAAAVNAIVAELGANPSGSLATVQARLVAIEARLTTTEGNVGAFTDRPVLRWGFGAPKGADGFDGDWFIDKAAAALYGPKVGGSWGVSVSLVGPKGPPGERGERGLEGVQGQPGKEGPEGREGPEGPPGGDITDASELPVDLSSVGMAASDVKAALIELAQGGAGGGEGLATLRLGTVTSYDPLARTAKVDFPGKDDGVDIANFTPWAPAPQAEVLVANIGSLVQGIIQIRDIGQGTGPDFTQAINAGWPNTVPGASAPMERPDTSGIARRITYRGEFVSRYVNTPAVFDVENVLGQGAGAVLVVTSLGAVRIYDPNNLNVYIDTPVLPRLAVSSSSGGWQSVEFFAGRLYVVDNLSNSQLNCFDPSTWTWTLVGNADGSVVQEGGRLWFNGVPNSETSDLRYITTANPTTPVVVPGSDTLRGEHEFGMGWRHLSAGGGYLWAYKAAPDNQSRWHVRKADLSDDWLEAMATVAAGPSPVAARGGVNSKGEKWYIASHGLYVLKPTGQVEVRQNVLPASHHVQVATEVVVLDDDTILVAGAVSGQTIVDGDMSGRAALFTVNRHGSRRIWVDNTGGKGTARWNWYPAIGLQRTGPDQVAFTYRQRSPSTELVAKLTLTN